MENKTQEEKIKAAKNAYIQLINNPRYSDSGHRYQVYLDYGKGECLDCLWPMAETAKQHVDGSSFKLLNHQVMSKSNKWPKYHFYLSGCQYSKEGDIRYELNRINPVLNVYQLTGYYPSYV